MVGTANVAHLGRSSGVVVVDRRPSGWLPWPMGDLGLRLAALSGALSELIHTWLGLELLKAQSCMMKHRVMRPETWKDHPCSVCGVPAPKAILGLCRRIF
jgi:hypothetical protein